MSLQFPWHPYTQVWMLSGQWAHDTTAALTRWLSTAAAPPMPLCPCPHAHAHGHVHAWLQAIPLSMSISSWAPIGTGKALDMEQGAGSPGQLPPWQPSREAAVWQPSVCAGAVHWGSAISLWVQVLAVAQRPCPALGPMLDTLSLAAWRDPASLCP